MIYPHNASEQLDTALFQTPPAEYRGIPFWSWNCRLTRERIDEQLEYFQEMGFGGVDIHPRTGLDTEYLGEEYMQLIRYTVKRCNERGLRCWLYDEDRFPSGNAGGLVTKNYRFRGRFLLLTEQCQNQNILPGYCEDRTAFEIAISAGEHPLGYFAAAYELEFKNNCLENYRRLSLSDGMIAAREAGKEKRVRFAYVKLMEEEQWFEDQSYVDTMNPEAIAKFIRITHDAYYKAVGGEFGKCIPAIFTDEPRIGKHVQITVALSAEEITIPYTEYFADQMMEKLDLDPLDIAPEYIWELPERKSSENRYRYRDMVSECFVRAYMDQISRWCKQHKIAMTGHVLYEYPLSFSVYAVEDCMRCYRSMDLPGIDILCDFKEFATAKQAVSVARQSGKEGVVSELYGVTHWDCTFKTFKLQGDWQAALGITVRIPHLSHMSLKGEAKRDWPGSIFCQSPWYQEFSYVEDHFARLNTALTRGTAIAKIAVIHPVESMWLYFGPNDQTAGLRRDMDQDFESLTEWLLYDTLDFDFISEALLPEQYQGLSESGEALKVGCMEYSAVVVPGLKTIRSTTLEILEEFRKAGGTVVFMGRIPDLADARPSGRPAALADTCVCIPKERQTLCSALESHRNLEIRKEDGCQSDNLFYQMRQDHEVKWLFICHVKEENHQLSISERYQVKIRGIYNAALYDTMTGAVRDIPNRSENGWTVMKISMYHEDSILLRLNHQEVTGGLSAPFVDSPVRSILKIDRPESFCRLEPNVLLLDYAKYSVDGGERRDKEELLRADNQIREQLGFPLRHERIHQPWYETEGKTHRVTLYFEIFSDIETEARLAMEDIDQCSVYLNGTAADMTPHSFYVDRDIPVIRLPKLCQGENLLTIEMDYNRKSGLENCYLLGDFDVELNGAAACIKEARNQLFWGDITRQGMPFYTGSLEYSFSVHAGESGMDCSLHLPHFCAPVLSVYVDGEKYGLIAYAPHRLDLKHLSPGNHEVTVQLYGNRYNSFGTLHNANKNYVWYGPNSYRTTGDDWTDDYMLRPVGILSDVEVEIRS